MRSRPLRSASLLLLVALAACSSPTAEQPSTLSGGLLSDGVVARVGSTTVPASLVSRIAAAQRLAPKAARDVAVRDALFAAGALDRGLDAAPAVGAAIRARLARASLEHIHDEARATPPTDAELAEATAAHFYEFDRPPSARTLHAVAQFPAKADAAGRAKTRAVAEQIARAVAGVRDPDEFRKRAEAVPHEGVEVRVEEPGAVAADGRIVAPGSHGTLVLPFAEAANRLASPGDQSGLVETEFGFHVILLLEKLPEHRVSIEERRAAMREEIWAERVRERMAELTRELRERARPDVPRSADALLAEVPVGR